MANEDLKALAQTGATQLADHFLKINEQNSARMLKESAKIQIIDNITRDQMSKAVKYFREIGALTGAANNSSKLVTKWLNKLVGELHEPKERFHYGLARAYYRMTVQATNKAIHRAGAVKEWAFLRFLVKSLSNINLADEKIFVPAILREGLTEEDY
jgi:hypothetical protein